MLCFASLEMIIYLFFGENDYLISFHCNFFAGSMELSGFNSPEFNPVPLSIALVFVGTTIIAINILTLATFIKSTSLRCRGYVMVINLAVADLLFGATGIPPTVALILKPTNISFYITQTLTKFSKMVSLFTLCVIAVERMHAIVWPIRHRVLPTSLYKTALVLIWVLSAVVTTIIVVNLAGYGALNRSVLNFLLPVAIVGSVNIISVCYLSIWISVRRRKRRKLDAPIKHEKTLAITLLLVAGAFVVTWAIPALFASISRMCRSCLEPNMTFQWCMYVLMAVQSVINPVIYCFRIPGFKNGLKRRRQRVKCSYDIQPPRLRNVTIESQITSVSENLECDSVTPL